MSEKTKCVYILTEDKEMNVWNNTKHSKRYGETYDQIIKKGESFVIEGKMEGNTVVRICHGEHAEGLVIIEGHIKDCMFLKKTKSADEIKLITY